MQNQLISQLVRSTWGSRVMLMKPLHMVAMMKAAKLNQTVGIESMAQIDTWRRHEEQRG